MHASSWRCQIMHLKNNCSQVQKRSTRNINQFPLLLHNPDRSPRLKPLDTERNSGTNMFFKTETYTQSIHREWVWKSLQHLTHSLSNFLLFTERGIESESEKPLWPVCSGWTDLSSPCSTAAKTGICSHERDLSGPHPRFVIYLRRSRCCQ